MAGRGRKSIADERRAQILDAFRVCAVRSGFIRVAPHFYNTEEDMRKLARTMNKWKN